VLAGPNARARKCRSPACQRSCAPRVSAVGKEEAARAYRNAGTRGNLVEDESRRSASDGVEAFPQIQEAALYVLVPCTVEDKREQDLAHGHLRVLCGTGGGQVKSTL
jgi:hypothetical protein